MQIRMLVAVLLLSVATSCKSTSDYLADLDNLNPAPPTGAVFLNENSIVFDAGQLGHEAFAGLSTADTMLLWEAMRALSHGCEFLGKARHNTLLQADAAVLIGVLVSHMPIPPLREELKVVKASPDKTKFKHQPTIEHVVDLVKAREALRIPVEIEILDSPDEVQKLEAYANLKDWTGEDLGKSPDAWRDWYEINEADYVRKFVNQSQSHLEYLGRIKLESASESRSILRILSFWVRDYWHQDLEPYYIPAIMKVARQAATMSLVEAMMRNRDPVVRADVAKAMTMIRDPSFGESLTTQLPLERNGYAAAKMIQALRYYPSRKTIEQIILSMGLNDPQINENAAEVLSELTGQRFGPFRDEWVAWWRDSGAKNWP